MTLQIVSHPQVAQWVMDRMPEEGVRSINEIGPFVAFGVVKDGQAICGVVYNWFRKLDHGNDMRVIIVSENPSWCLPGVLRELFSYPFEHAGCERLTAVVKEGNTTSLKLCQGLGFRKEGVVRRGYNGKTNAIILGMLKSECKWLHRGHEKENRRGKKEQLYASAARRDQDDRCASGSQQNCSR